MLTSRILTGGPAIGQSGEPHNRGRLDRLVGLTRCRLRDSLSPGLKAASLACRRVPGRLVLGGAGTRPRLRELPLRPRDSTGQPPHLPFAAC